MGVRSLTLLIWVVLPGLSAAGASAYYGLGDWAALTAAHHQYQQLAQDSSSSLKALAIAEAAENRHRLNCFAEGVGVLLGWAVVTIGIHGLCTLSRDRPSVPDT
jgi:hypothetical protein